MTYMTTPTNIIVKGSKPVLAIKKGTMKRCGHEGCTMLLRYTVNGTWTHSIRQPYDHKPVSA